MKNNSDELDTSRKNTIHKSIIELINSCYTLKEELLRVGICSIYTDNIGILMNNKIIELQRQFEKKGLSIYTNHFVSEAIINDLFDIASNNIQHLEQISYEKKSPIKRFFYKLSNLLYNNKKIILENSNQESIDIVSHIEQYNSGIQKLSNYNLNENIVTSIVKFMKTKNYSIDLVSDILDECFMPDLNKLGLTDAIPNLKEKILKEYQQSLSFKERLQVELPTLGDPTKNRPHWHDKNHKNYLSNEFSGEDFSNISHDI